MIRQLLETFRPPHYLDLAKRELAEARRELLKAESGLDYATAIVEYNRSRVIRLEIQLQESCSGGSA